MSKIIKVILDNGDELEYVEKPREFFTDNALRELNFKRQHSNFEKDILSLLELDLEEWARYQYNLIAESECEDCYSQDTNIYNQDFIDRFSVIISRGDDVEIEKMLDLLEYRFKIG